MRLLETRLERLLSAARALREQIGEPPPPDSRADAERADPALVADRLRVPLTAEEREQVRRPPEPGEEHLSLVALTRTLWKSSYGPDRPWISPAQMASAEVEGAGERLMTKLLDLARRLEDSGSPPHTQMEMLALLWFGKAQDDEQRRARVLASPEISGRNPWSGQQPGELVRGH